MRKGLYEQVIDADLRAVLDALAANAQTERMDAADSHGVLAAHLVHLIAAVMRRQPAADRLERQRELFNRVIGVLGEFDPHLAANGLAIPGAPEQLLAVYDGERPPVRPSTPASTTSLLTASGADPSLVSQLRQELVTADRFDMLCAFVKWSGFGLLRDALEAFTARDGTRLRVLTTSYMGATDVPAVRALAALPNTEVRVSYDTHRTRLHAKAYLFERESAFSTAYIGSANLSRPALTEGLEWVLKVTQYADPAIWHKVLGTFQTWWEDPEFEPFDEAKLRDAIERERSPGASHSVVPAFELRPFQFQQEVLDTLALDRASSTPPHRQLVVAATGTGKTMIAAFDYRRETAANGGRYPSLLFVAHRVEILQQSLVTFRAVLRDQNFGSLMTGDHRPEQTEHLFATIQSIAQGEWLRQHSSEAFDYVVIDETHRSAAESYQALLEHIQPRILLGLTATPERTDGGDILRYFDDRIVSELRLPDAINRRLVVPFHYFGVSDSVDYRDVSWERGGYRVSELDNLVTGNEVRAELVVRQCQRRLHDIRECRALGFCVSVRHAEYMADFFQRSGIPALALSGATPRAIRDAAPKRLKSRELNFIFVADLYNEGIDIPEVDTVLFLRPTESLSLFLQQLGRGLRLTEDKDYLTVLDFVGRMHRKFRFDVRLRALSTDPNVDLRREISADFPHLPAGCSIELERVARERVLRNIQESLLAGQPQLIRDIADFEHETGRPLTLAAFLAHHRLSLDDVYRRASWSRLCQRAGLRAAFTEPDELRLAKWLRRIAHADDIERLSRWAEWLQNGEGDDALVLALCIPLVVARDQQLQSAADVWAMLQRNPVLLNEARMLVDHLRARPLLSERATEAASVPLVLHATYTRDEILVLAGDWSWTSQPPVQAGVRYLAERKFDLFFTTLTKTEQHYSPTTMYEDYAIDAHHFHWQSQSTTAEDSPTGRRYIQHQETGDVPLLFVREMPKIQGLAQPYAYLGALEYVEHSGSRPMSIIWRMRQAIPARLLRRYKRLD